jgi:hypothetical protein
MCNSDENRQQHRYGNGGRSPLFAGSQPKPY